MEKPLKEIIVYVSNNGEQDVVHITTIDHLSILVTFTADKVKIEDYR